MPVMISFASEQVFVVTGASSGIGESVALALNGLGAAVIAIGRDAARLSAVRARAKAPERFFVEQKDLTADLVGLGGYVRELVEKYGKLSGLASCAGVSDIRPLQLFDPVAAKEIFDVNYFVPVMLLKGLSDRRNVADAGAACVVVASAAAELADKGQCAYAGSKAALIASVRVIAKEVAAKGLRVNAVSPTVVATPMTAAYGEAYVRSQAQRQPFGLGEPADVSNLVVYLLSEKARWITGQNYTVDCGSF